MPNCRRI